MRVGSITLALVTFAFVFGGATFGMYLRKTLPQTYLTAETQDGVKETMVFIVTMSALVLGLLVASAKGHYDSEVDMMMQLSANFITLDRILANYGPETKEARTQLREIVLTSIERMPPERDAHALQSAEGRPGEVLMSRIHELAPKDDEQRVLKSQALSCLLNIASTRWLFFLHRTASTPLVLVFILIFWLTVIFIRLGMSYPSNAVELASLLLAALSIAAAVLLIMKFYSPYEGWLRMPITPLQTALQQIGQ